MFYEIFANPVNNTSTILNIKNRNVFELSNYFRKKRIDIQDKKKLHIGLMQDGSSYSIYLGQFGLNVYNGRFPMLSDNIIIFSHEIRIKNILFLNGGILLQIRCNCWGAYEIEIPMYMEQTIYLDTSRGVLSNGILVATTYTPFMIYNKKDYKNIESIVKIPLERCFESFSDLTYYKSKNSLNFYGYNITPNTLTKLRKPVNILENMRRCELC